MKVYPSGLAEAIVDVTRLSRAMTLKQAAAGLPYGGGKAVLAVPEVFPVGSPEREGLLRAYAELIEDLDGAYVTAADMNTGPADLDVIGEVTPHVLGRSPARGGSGDSGEGTAIGVFHGIVATVEDVLGASDDPEAPLRGRTVAIQGVGSVGGRLARLLADAGATLTVSDVHPERADVAATDTGARVVEPDEVVDEACDVFAPCATGGVLSAEIIPRLRCRIIAGAANNQLATPEDGARLAEAGIVYAPDHVINAGGVLHLAGSEALGWDAAEMRARLEGIGDTLRDVYRIARDAGITPAEAGDRLALDRIAAAGGART